MRATARETLLIALLVRDSIENAPCEFFLFGNGALLCAMVDIWSLGLTTLHMASTGKVPYEEVFKDKNCQLFCPPELKADLQEIFINDQLYANVRAVLDEVNDDCKKTVYDTIYRYCVMFDHDDQFLADNYERYAVVRTLALVLKGLDVKQLEKIKRGSPSRRIVKTLTSVACFNDYRALYGLSHGGNTRPTNPYFARVQKVLEHKGGMDLLFQMCEFDPSKRLPLEQVLQHRYLNVLCADAAADDSDMETDDEY